mgnify:CR=1 FL=1
MNFLRRFMAGRYGSDQLNNALLLLAIVLMVIEWVMKWNWMSMFILALFILCYFRMFSRNIQARYAENQKFLQKWEPVSRRLHNAVLRFQDRKTHRYFKCPNCHKRLRVRRAAARSRSPARTAERSLSGKAEKPLIAQIQDGFLIFDAKYRNVGRYSV